VFGYQQKNSVLYHLEDPELEFCVGKITTGREQVEIIVYSPITTLSWKQHLWVIKRHSFTSVVATTNQNSQ